MKTLEQAFTERRSVFKAAEKNALDILDNFCRREGFLLVGRLKTLESIRDKLETGGYAELDAVDDLIAFSIVTDIIRQEEKVITFVRETFQVITIKSKTTLQDERTFDFDCTRIYCKLNDPLKQENGVSSVTLEIQIRTILQHAWSKITHPQVYKADKFDARAARLAAELMAQLESVDRSLAEFEVRSQSVKLIERREMVTCTEIITMVDRLIEAGVIPSESRPQNGRRLGENIFSSTRKDVRQQPRRLLTILEQFFVAQSEQFPRSVSLFQLAIVALYDAGALEHVGRKYYVTDDLISLFPTAANIPHRISID